MIPTQVAIDTLGMITRFEYVAFGLLVGTAYFLARLGAAHVRPDTVTGQYTYFEMTRTVYIGVIAGIITAHTVPSRWDGALFLLVPVADELLFRVKEHRQTAYEGPGTATDEQRAGEADAQSATQAYVEDEIGLLELENRLEEEIELEDDW